MSGELNHSPVRIIRQLLEDSGVVTDPSSNGSWPGYISLEPNTPDNVVTLFDTTGRLDGRLQVTGETQHHHGISVRIRSGTYDDGFSKANDITEEFDNVLETSVTIGSDAYKVQAINLTTGVIPLGQEETSNRRLFTINAVATVRKTS